MVANRIMARSAVLAALIFPAITHACSIVYPSVQIGRAFAAHVQDQHVAVSGLRLELVPCVNDSCSLKGPHVRYSVTDSQGYARFAGLDPGTYFLSPDHDDGPAGGVYVDASASGSDTRIAELNWPGRAPIIVRNISGTLRGPNYYPQWTQVPLSLSLLEGASGKEIDSTHADEKGRFSFEQSPAPGLYFIRLNPSGLTGWSGEQIEGLIAVEVSPNAAQNQPFLDVDFGWSSCGLEYRQEQTPPDISVDRLCGTVVDPPGAAIQGAHVWLLSSKTANQIVDQTTSTSTGSFNLSKAERGDYRLLIKSPGFSPFLALVHLGDSQARPNQCQKPISVKLDVL